jgi:ribonuclease BN (tRNA processing enzyme)
LFDHEADTPASPKSARDHAKRVARGSRLSTFAAMNAPASPAVAVTFAGSGDAFGSGGRYQACIHLRDRDRPPVLLDCGATSLSALKTLGLDPGEISTVFVSHLHGDHFGGLPFLILDGQFSRRINPLTVAGPPGTVARLHQAMEVMFPGSASIDRRFRLDVVELTPGQTTTVADVAVASWEVAHPSGASSLALRLDIGGRTVAYTGDTAWTGELATAAAGADLLIAEAYYFDKAIPYHLRHADLAEHRSELTSRRIVLTHLSADMLSHRGGLGFDVAYDGLTIQL